MIYCNFVTIFKSNKIFFSKSLANQAFTLIRSKDLASAHAFTLIRSFSKRDLARVKAFTLIRSKDLASAHAFTLIELLVAIAIVGILAAFTLVSYKGVQMTGRDAKRKADLEQIKTAVKMYQQDYGLFPTSLLRDTSIGLIPNDCSTFSDDWAAGGLKKLEPNYFTNLPLDPRNSCANYYIYKSEISGFWVGGVLENPGGNTCDSASGFTAPINYCFRAN